MGLQKVIETKSKQIAEYWTLGPITVQPDKSVTGVISGYKTYQDYKLGAASTHQEPIGFESSAKIFDFVDLAITNENPYERMYRIMKLGSNFSGSTDVKEPGQ